MFLVLRKYICEIQLNYSLKNVPLKLVIYHRLSCVIHPFSQYVIYILSHASGFVLNCKGTLISNPTYYSHSEGIITLRIAMRRIFSLFFQIILCKLLRHFCGEILVVLTVSKIISLSGTNNIAIFDCFVLCADSQCEPQQAAHL